MSDESPRDATVAELVSAAQAGSARAVARLISYVEDESPLLREVMQALIADGVPARQAQVIGLTGPPGVGKSTTTNALVKEYRSRGLRVGVLAVDPSSPFSGGALLGDRVRMQDHAGDVGVYIRSMAARGHLGGLAWSTPQAVRVLEAAGCDVVLVETVGVGQSEIEIASHADQTVVLLSPGAGDGIQAAKAGVLEIADVFVVNKADRDGADRTARELRQVLAMSPREGWSAPVLKTVATRGEGLAALVDALAEHRAWQESSGELGRRREARAEREIEGIAFARLRKSWSEGAGSRGRARALAAQVAQGHLDSYAAADRLLAQDN